MPQDFQFPPTDREVEMWSPLTLDLTALASRPHRMYQAIGRLAPGATIDQARQDMAAVAGVIARENPDTQTGWGVTLVPAHEQVVGKIGETLWILFGAVVLVLVIACANIANLLLARSTRAAQGLRGALGVRRERLGAPPALARRKRAAHAVGRGGRPAARVVGHRGAAAADSRERAARRQHRPRPVSARRSPPRQRSSPGLIFGLVPAWRAMRPNLMDIFQEGGRGSTASRATRRLSDVMVVAEVALALMLLVSAGLLIRSFIRLTSVDPGYRTIGHRRHAHRAAGEVRGSGCRSGSSSRICSIA